MESIDKINGTFGKRPLETSKTAVSGAVIKRLPRYYRYLGDLKSEGITRISSGELSKLMGRCSTSG